MVSIYRFHLETDAICVSLDHRWGFFITSLLWKNTSISTQCSQLPMTHHIPQWWYDNCGVIPPSCFWCSRVSSFHISLDKFNILKFACICPFLDCPKGTRDSKKCLWINSQVFFRLGFQEVCNNSTKSWVWPALDNQMWMEGGSFLLCFILVASIHELVASGRNRDHNSL